MPMQAQRGGVGIGSNPIRSRQWEVGDQHSALAALSPGNDNTHCVGGWVGLGVGLDGTEIPPPRGIHSWDRPVRKESLYWLRYTGRRIHTHYTWWLQNVPIITVFLINTKQYYHISYIYFKQVPLCNYTRLPRVKIFLDAISWKAFQFFRHIPNYVTGITTAQPIQCRFQSWERVKISWSQVCRVWVWSTVVTFSFAKKSLPKPTGVLEHWFSNLRVFPSHCSSKTTKDLYFFVNKKSNQMQQYADIYLLQSHSTCFGCHSTHHQEY